MQNQIPSQIVKTALDCMPQLFSYTNMCGFVFSYTLASSQTQVVNWHN